MKSTRLVQATSVLACIFIAANLASAQEESEPDRDRLSYVIVDTGQDACFNSTQETPYPKPGEAFFGQDAHYVGNVPSYKDNGDGTITDINTGLMWQKTPDLKNKSTFAAALAGAKRFRLGGYDDWRLPTIKELYSLMLFSGLDVSPESLSGETPFIDTDYFDFAYGNVSAGERAIDAQYWSSTEYVATTMGGMPTTFGVNFADGRIKGYGRRHPGGRGEMRQFVRHVRGNPNYGKNDFVDNGDGTITDRATGLLWMKKDSGKTMNWPQALGYAEGLTYAGHDDWRAPNAKELQSIVDYSRSPSAPKPSPRGPALDPIFDITATESWFWTSTTHQSGRGGSAAVYICFGRSFGYMGPRGGRRKIDVHGAGAQRSDPKVGDPDDWPQGRGPQGDEIRIYNYIRCVRGGAATPRTTAPASRRAATREAPTTGPPRRPDGAHFVRRLDRNGDGKVSLREFDGPRNHFRRLDRNGDGYLSASEAPQGPPPPRRRPR